MIFVRLSTDKPIEEEKPLDLKWEDKSDKRIFEELLYAYGMVNNRGAVKDLLDLKHRELENLKEEIIKLQTYLLFEGSKEKMVELDDVLNLIDRHMEDA